MGQHQFYDANFLRYARKVAFDNDEAWDLLQSALVTAIENGRADMSCVHNRRWLIGVLRNQAAFCARTALRRRQRDAAAAFTHEEQSADDTVCSEGFIATLPPSLKTTALLALAGQTKEEIAWLLRVPDTAMRQRIVQLKRRWTAFDGRAVAEFIHLRGELDFGWIRQSLLKSPCLQQAILATHDHDGHLFMLSSQNNPARQHSGKFTHKKEKNDVQ